MTDSDRQGFMREAISLARKNVREGGGGPFAALVVADNRVISTGVNRVTGTNDPTAHAEMEAIRAACRTLNRFDLEGMELYTTCEPCPMCLGAVYWARLDRVYYAATRSDAADAGFDDAVIYEEVSQPANHRTLPFETLLRDEAVSVMKEWAAQPDRKLY